jgi:hypothetical protein
MKYIFIILTIAITSCTAQTRFPQRTVSQTHAQNLNFETQIGDYIKDVENKLNNNEGT